MTPAAGPNAAQAGAQVQAALAAHTQALRVQQQLLADAIRRGPAQGLADRLALVVAHERPHGQAEGAAELTTAARPAQWLAAGPGGQVRLDVYQNAYAARLVGALRDNFDVLARALGDDGFEALGRAYLAAQPSAHASIRWFGDGLTRFMQERAAADDPLVPHPALVDLARLDWALRQAFDAADAPVLDANALAQLPAEAWPSLCWRLHPSVQLLALHWAVAPAWHALRAAADAQDDEPTLPPPQASAHQLLVWRRGLDTQWRVLTDNEAALLALVQDGADFSAQCALVADQLAGPARGGAQGLVHADQPTADAAVPQVVTLLQRWLVDGLISALQRPGGAPA